MTPQIKINPTTRSLRILTAPVKNPNRDKRHKYGMRSWDTLPVGTVVEYVHRTAVVDNVPDVYFDSWVDEVGGRGRTLGYSDVAKLVYECSEPHYPNTFTELCTLMGERAECIALEVIDALVADGTLTLDRLSLTIDEVNKGRQE